jgi:ubiquitin conjugation factor E4 B
LLLFVLTFLTSTWCIKNPFLKSKINDVSNVWFSIVNLLCLREQLLFFGAWYGRNENGILGGVLNTHPMALKHLMPALMHFYIGKW